MKVFFIGGGNIAKIVYQELRDEIEKCWYYDVIETDLPCERLERFFVPEDADVVVECASVDAVKQYGLDVLKSGKDFYIISSGAFSDVEFFDKFMEELKRSSQTVYIPSGAIGGLDIIRAVKKFISKVELVTRKPPKAFNLENLSEEQVIFSGNARQAIEEFPQNTNVSMTLSLAVGDFDKVDVRIVADPKIEENVHEINIYSSVGEYKIIHKNKPSPNPKTSYLAPLSLVSALRKRAERFQVG
ncbi:aspartate dehydrogenase [Fervidobacterium changbaicum]|uniref:L-aspartate dehydrogenase n=1 Tax=Fervidobacterium changbaicum TaxID=310769 RepID=A0ABX5QSD2_9BACT|nr:aspartate dehydrogenase [Fervidobacterium changbaicum]QAV33335.1 aspartate dehydrogenase [Fervidobacterium changbaicum]SDG88868.1 aspartate dehydrogenase [Fervidobacterium changbaicum]